MRAWEVKVLSPTRPTYDLRLPVLTALEVMQIRKRGLVGDYLPISLLKNKKLIDEWVNR
jgi:hypothetical protein